MRYRWLDAVRELLSRKKNHKFARGWRERRAYRLPRRLITRARNTNAARKTHKTERRKRRFFIFLFYGSLSEQKTSVRSNSANVRFHPRAARLAGPCSSFTTHKKLRHANPIQPYTFVFFAVCLRVKDTVKKKTRSRKPTSATYNFTRLTHTHTQFK